MTVALATTAPDASVTRPGICVETDSANRRRDQQWYEMKRLIDLIDPPSNPNPERTSTAFP